MYTQINKRNCSPINERKSIIEKKVKHMIFISIGFLNEITYRTLYKRKDTAFISLSEALRVLSLI